MSTYQSHDGGPAVSNSSRKLERIALPLSLEKKTLLDIGCNEGFFCGVAATRGAANVIGIDSDENALNFAKQKYGSASVCFEKRSWHDLPAGPFDVVLWLSAMHYEHDPLSVFKNIVARLKPGGLFILECGVYPYDRESLYQIPIGKSEGVNIYPTFQLLELQLSKAGLSFRLVGSAENTLGDKVPRFVYHCRKRIPTVVVLRGKSQVGKTSLARLLKPVASKLITIDGLVEIISRSDFAGDPVRNFLNKEFDHSNLEPVIDGIDSAGITREYVGFIRRAICGSDELAVIEGYVTDKQFAELARQLDGSAVLWDAASSSGKQLERLGANIV